MAHTPLAVLAKNFGISEAALADIPKDPDHERYIFNGEVPPALASDVVQGPAGTAMRMTHRLLEQEPVEVPGGRVRIVDSSNFPAASTIAAALVELDPGVMRELHWHPTNDEWQYYISGYVPFAMSHYILNTGTEPLRFLEMFKSSRYADVSLNQWLSLTPPELVKAHLNLDDATTTAVTAHQGRSPIVR
jgi:oxalate decarboxylase